MSVRKNEELIMKLFKREPQAKVSSSNIAKATGITKTELNRALNYLIDQGDLVRNGSGPKTSYSLSPAVKGIADFAKNTRVVGRPKLDEGQVKKKRDVRVSDENMALIEEHGFTLQGILDQAIGSLKPISDEELKAFRESIQKHFPVGKL